MKRGKIIENSTAFLTYSIAPYHEDHLLVVPKRHTEEFLEITDQELKDMNDLQKRALGILSKLGHEGTSILIRNGKNSGKSVAHLHCNIIPDTVLGNIDFGSKEREIMTDEKISDLYARFKSVGIEF